MLNGVKITQLDLPFVKEYLKVDYDDEDRTIEMLIVASRSFIETMLGYKIQAHWTNHTEIPDELTVASMLLIAHWFDNRQMQTAGTVGNEIKFAVTSIVEAHKDPLKDYDEELDNNSGSSFIIG